MSEWQLIETAPRDGAHILIGWFYLPGQYSIHTAMWHQTEKRPGVACTRSSRETRETSQHTGCRYPRRRR